MYSHLYNNVNTDVYAPGSFRNDHKTKADRKGGYKLCSVNTCFPCKDKSYGCDRNINWKTDRLVKNTK